jgi:polyadenylate-binding protein
VPRLTDSLAQVGDHLFKKIRSFGVKGAPKISAYGESDASASNSCSPAPSTAITLLDSEDLRALAHLMNSYPEVLRQKVTFLAGGGAK